MDRVIGISRRKFAWMLAAVASGGRAFAAERKSPVPVKVSGPDSLRVHGAAAGLPVGCAVVPELLDLHADPASGSPFGSQDLYTRTVVEQAGILVAENAMKWSSMRPTPTTFHFDSADKLFEFAAANDQFVRGHNLCWHEQLPGWFADAANRDNARSLLTQHIETVAGRYAGRVHSWDVVNEAVNIQDGRADGLRRSPWLELIGPEYIELAFTTAAKADPHAKLTYNDYDIELDTPEQTEKRGQVLMLVRRLRARGIPIHALGIQSHLQADGPRPGAGVVSLIREAAKMGLEVYITELDVNTHTLGGGAEAQDAAVAAVYRDYLGLVLREPNVRAVLTWGISDAHTWLNQSKQPWALRPDGARQRPLPFDEEYHPTAAFFALRSAVDSAVRLKGPAAPADGIAPKVDSQPPIRPFAVPGSPAVPAPPPEV